MDGIPTPQPRAGVDLVEPPPAPRAIVPQARPRVRPVPAPAPFLPALALATVLQSRPTVNIGASAGHTTKTTWKRQSFLIYTIKETVSK